MKTRRNQQNPPISGIFSGLARLCLYGVLRFKVGDRRLWREPLLLGTIMSLRVLKCQRKN
ncbi:hypothetical protein Pcar_3247 [Syntrophotalea carbinolica DSM 2380]|uniref:Uncharacterized protein n=1 Tax=Syntrophotalea carbinolica (strain DSM 2380 / NBRC 103641 / GraBd1) TaxID=338963 RepID=Q0C6S0_SYNC1|nr:hypothetical protein Pcar_3247 [Syntrophotalea carbinolica DSM 2380]